MKKLITQKLILKYITLVVLGAMLVSLIIYIILDFINRSGDRIFIFILFCSVIIFIFNSIYNHRIKLMVKPRDEYINDILYYFANAKYSYFEYTEAITWFSRSIHRFFVSGGEQSEIVNRLHLVLRPDKSGLCCAVYHRNQFIELANLMLQNPLDTTQIDYLINSILSAPNEREPFFPMLKDSNIIKYCGVIVAHSFGCLLIAKTNDGILISAVIANLLICIPADILWILIYCGIIKDKKDTTNDCK